MTYPVNNPTSYSKNYGTEGPENDPDYPEDDDLGMDEEPGEGFDDEFVDGTENQYSGPVTREAEIVRVRELIKHTDDPKIKGKLKEILLTLKQLVFLSEEEHAIKLAELDQIITTFEGDIYTAEAEEEAAKGGLQGQIDEIKEQAKESLDKGLIIPETYNLIDEDLVKAQAILDLEDATEGQIEEAELFILNAKELLDTTSTQPVSAQKLAQELKKPIEDIVAAAEDAGVDLDNLKVDDKLMKMLQALEIPSSEDVTNRKTLQDNWSDEVNVWSGKGDTATVSWKADSEDLPDITIWRKLYKFYSKTDPISSQIKDLDNKMGTAIGDALKALGLDVAAGSQPGRIMVNGTEYDFITEDTNTLKLDTVFNNLTDPYFSPAPRNTEAGDYWTDEACDYWKTVGNGGTSTGSGYPCVTFSMDG